MSNRAYSESDASAENSENIFCIFLHVVEGTGLNRKEDIIGSFYDRRKDKILLNASLNGVKFEVVGYSTETSAIFNSNCIWECELGDIKRMKTDNRPVKLECFTKSGRTDNEPRKVIGSLLLPIRGLQVVSSMQNIQLNLHWHKLGALSSEWRQYKPELYLLLIIVKKALIESGQFETFLGRDNHVPNDIHTSNISETALMLQSQSNIYVQLLEQVGLIQVGNNPDTDCDIFNVTLTFKMVKNLRRLLELERTHRDQKNIFVFHYDFLGSVSHVEMVANSSDDSYNINEKISISFKTSLRSLRTYFQCIFHVPINLYLNGIAIANYTFEFSKLMPDDTYFNLNQVWTHNGTFHFDRLHRILSPRSLKPCVDYLFSMELLTSYAKINSDAHTVPINTASIPDIPEEKLVSDNISDCYRNLDFSQTVLQQTRLPCDNCNCNNMEIYARQCDKAISDPTHEVDLLSKSSNEFIKETSTEKEERQRYAESIQNAANAQTYPISIGTICQEKDFLSTNTKTVGVNTDPVEQVAPDTEELTLKIVQELEDWKAQQMDDFLCQLDRKEAAYLADLDKQWERQCAILQAKLEAKIDKCDELNAKLEKAHQKLDSSQDSARIAESVKRDIERSYEQKFQTVDMQMQRLKMEMQQKGTVFEIQHKHVQIENTKLQREKAQQQERIEQLEKQLAAMKKTHLSADQLKDMLADMRTQTERFADMEKSKNYYKQKWSRTTREVHKLKLGLLKQQEKCLLRDGNSNEIDFCLEEILSEEQEALKSDRSELKSIKDILLISSDTSSVCDPDAGR